MRSPNMRPMHSTDIAPDAFAPYAPNAFNRYCARMCRGALPHFRHIAPTGRECNKTQSWGGPRVSFTPFTIPWAEIPLPLQGATASKPTNNNRVLRGLNGEPRMQNAPNADKTTE